MSQVFGSPYAQQYDALYQDKDYEREVAQLESLFVAHAKSPVHTILDLGCGTGNHAFPLARRGYKVTGVDRSPAMLEQARGKAATAGVSAPEFHPGSAVDVDLHRTFDAVLMMFAVLGYQLTNADVLASLRTVRRHLEPGGLFVFDVWYGPAVLMVRPGERVKEMRSPEGAVLRAASTVLDTYHHLAEVRYRVWRLGGGPAVETAENHQMRFFFPQELALFLEQAGLALRLLGDFNDPSRVPDDHTWNVLGVAEAV